MAIEFKGTLGNLQVPIPEEPDNNIKFFGEPGLKIMAEYFQAFVNHYGGKAYESVAWDERVDDGGIIKYVFGHNPRERGEGAFRGTQTPAFYVYRLGSKEIYDMAEDEHVIVSDVMVLYVHSADNAEELAKRYPYTGAIVKLIDLAIERRRDVCFIMDSDTDSRKSWRGTHVWRQCGFDKVQLKEFRRSELEITDAESDGSWRYTAMDIIIEITERRVTSYADSDEVMGLELKVSENVSEGKDVIYPEYLRRIL